VTLLGVSYLHTNEHHVTQLLRCAAVQIEAASQSEISYSLSRDSVTPLLRQAAVHLPENVGGSEKSRLFIQLYFYNLCN